MNTMAVRWLAVRWLEVVGLVAVMGLLAAGCSAEEPSSGHDMAVREAADEQWVGSEEEADDGEALAQAPAPGADIIQGVDPSLVAEGYAGVPRDVQDVAATAAPPPPRTGGGVDAQAPAPVAPTGGESTRRIIKDGTISIEVDEVELGLSRIEGIAVQRGGYVVETSTDFSNPFWKSAYIKIAVPVDNFESALQSIREAAGRVRSEQASGVDVSQEFVDVQSQIANLEATQARVRQFLDQATTVEEALQVNAQLSEIERQLGQLKGRLQYLEQRSAFSTIAISLSEPEPDPTATATPTITPTPSATPTATPRPPWQPGRTAGDAWSAMSATLRSLGDIAIWLLFGILPVLVVLAIPFAVLWYVVRAARQRRS